MTGAALPFAGYIRVSRVNGRTGDSFISPEAQRESIERTARQHGLDIAEIVTELDVSGGKSIEARELGRLVRDVEASNLGEIIVWYVKRYSRDWLDGLIAFTRITQVRKDGSPAGRLYAEDFSHTGLGAASMLSFQLEGHEWHRTHDCLVLAA